MSENKLPAPDVPTEVLALADLIPHPRNYVIHPEEQLVHIQQSLRDHGVYRNIIISQDNYILAGHGVVSAALGLGMTEIAVYRAPVAHDHPHALMILTGDNELRHLAEKNDRELSELLKEINDEQGLMGTGWDAQMLANLVMVTRPTSEIKDFDAAAHWVGMPEYEDAEVIPKLIISFRNNADRERFIAEQKMTRLSRKAQTWSVWWPPKENDDTINLRFEESSHD